MLFMMISYSYSAKCHLFDSLNAYFLGFFAKTAFFLIFFLNVTLVPANNCLVFTSERELPSSKVNQVFQDSEGVIWVVTEDGLARFDGADFITFRKDEADTASLQNNYVRQVYEDAGGRLFVATLSGLQIYDRGWRRFSRVSPYIEGVKFSQGINVSSIVNVGDSNLVIGTSGHGIFVLREDEDGMRLEQDAELLPNCYYIETMLSDSAGNLWIATLDKGVFVLNRSRKVIANYTFAGNESCFSMVEAGNGIIYIGTSQGNLLKCDVATGKSSVMATQKQLHSAIVTMRLDGPETLLIGTDGDGLKAFNTNTEKLADYNLSLVGLSSNKLKVHSIMRDNRHSLWLGCFQQGVVLEPTADNEFVFIGSRSSVANTIGSCCVMSVTCDGDNIWVGTDNDGIYLLNSDFSLKHHYSADSQTGAIPRTVLCMYRDSRNNMWLGSYLDGLFRLNETTGRCERIEFRNNDDFNQATSVYSIVEDAHQNLWVAVLGVGLCRINLLTREQTFYRTIPSGVGKTALSNLLPHAWINTMLLVGNKLYFGGYGGFGCLDTETDDFVSALGKNSMLTNEVVYVLREDANGKIWIGTANGLYRFDSQTREFSKYTMTNGLPGNSISSIERSADGNLWISTNSGISCLNLQNQSFSNYYASDGLQCNEFSKAASSVNSNGMLFFGGMNGLICFYPQKISKHYSIPGIRLTNFYIHSKAVTMGSISGGRPIVDCDITKAEKVYLSHNDNSFSIEFAAIEFANPERISYLYNMDGKGWIHLNRRDNKVSFSNLKPGKHEFCVKAADGNSFSKTRRLIIHIAAPWYATILAYIIYALLFIMVIALGVLHLRRNHLLRMKVLEHKHAEDINEAKLQFFINISHEIRTPMSLIIGPLHKLMVTDTDAGRQRSYEIIRRNAERILNLINELMDIRKIDKDQMRLNFEELNIVDVVRDTCSNFEYQADLQDINLNFASTSPEIKAWVDADNFDKIIVNILSNAFKFTPRKGSINVNLTCEQSSATGKDMPDGCVVIDIEDSGTGINPDDLNRIFERFYQSQGKKSVSGTGVGLHLTKSLVELHHGTITAANNSDKPGCHFTIRLPLGASHLSEAEKQKKQKTAPEQNLIVPQRPTVALSDEAEAEAKKHIKTKYHVLIAEDDDEIRKYIADELSQDFHVQACVNGEEALDIVLRNTPDIVVCDVMMPLMDGLTLCKKIKQNITVNYLPVVLLTSLTNEDDHIAGLDVGADAYLTKPFNIDVLRHTIMNLVRGRIMLKNKFQGSQTQEAKLAKLEVNSPDDRLMQRIMVVINKNISNPDLNVEMIARTVGISRTHLHRKLREITNQSARDFIRNVRLQQAAALLAEKHHSISEIADNLGFANLSYFSTVFKETYGVSPSEYMEQNRGGKNN